MNATIVVVNRSVLNCFITTQCAVSQQINNKRPKRWK